MVAVVAGLLLAVVLLASAVAKAADGAGTRAALSTYGLRSEPAARIAWLALIAAEAGLAPAVALGSRPATVLAALLLAAFASAQLAALAAGREGAPCACLGGRSRLGRVSLGRTLVLLALAGIALAAPREALDTVQWLALGLAIALAGVAALAVVVLALAREIGMLRMAQPPIGALEVPGEGPEVGTPLPLAAAFGDELAAGRLGLAVFTSGGCAMCRALAPTVAAFGRHPHVALRAFDEVADAAAWEAAAVPGSPYAVVLDGGGTVLAKGTFNSGAQLESVLATAERRRAEAAGAVSPASTVPRAVHRRADAGDAPEVLVPPRTHAALAGNERR